MCGTTTDDEEVLSDSNWEYCEGLEKQFCSECRENREEPPCDKEDCEADVCFNHREQLREEAEEAEAAAAAAAATKNGGGKGAPASPRGR